MLESCVHARLPRGGLGNKLLVWARALVFAHTHGLPLLTSGWAEVKLGPYLRRERSKRQYWGYFPHSPAPGLLQQALLAWAYQPPIVEPALDMPLGDVAASRQVCVFERVPPWEDYFQGLRGHEGLVSAAFHQALGDGYARLSQAAPKPTVAVHVRRSDFRELAPGEVLGKACNVRTPIDFYVDVVNGLRAIAGHALPVTVFTDGRAEDVRALLDLPQVTMAAHNPDIVDLILMSQARCLVTSAGSTFSYWAAYMSEASVILHPGHDVAIRSDAMRAVHFEGPLPTPDQPSELLRQNLRALGPAPCP
jgi:hypothetical protein